MQSVFPLRTTNSRLRRGFSLVELLAVIGIIALMSVLVAPALKRTDSDFTNSVYAIQAALDQARTFAVSNNTYTWVGFFEENGASPSIKPAQVGIGRLVISIVASQDGTSIYNRDTALNGSSQTLDSSRLIQIEKLIVLNGVSVLDASTRAVGQRPAGLINSQKELIALSTATPLFTFTYPLTGTPQYTFGAANTNGSNGIVQFNAQGEAMSCTGPLDTPVANLEICIQPATGSTVVNSSNLAALDLCGLTGQTTIYRP